MNATNQGCTCNNWILIYNCLFQIPLNLCKKSSICNTTNHTNSICSIHISFAIHVLHERACHNNNLLEIKQMEKSANSCITQRQWSNKTAYGHVTSSAEGESSFIIRQTILLNPISLDWKSLVTAKKTSVVASIYKIGAKTNYPEMINKQMITTA